VISEVAQLVTNAVLIGSLVALGAVGLTLTFRVGKFANVAHPEFMTLGAYSTFAYNAGLGLPLPAAALVGVITAVPLALLVAQLTFELLPVRTRVQMLIVSIGLALVIRGAIRLAFGSELLQYETPLQRPLVLGVVLLTPTQLVTLLVAVCMMAATHFVLVSTRTGRILRALGDNPRLCEVSGVDTRAARTRMWVLTLALATVGGVLYGANLVIQPGMGADLLIPIFSAAVLGGLGNPYGALAGALLVSLAQELSTLVVPSVWKEAVAFGVLALCLLFRPNGLWGR
jgi:branched-chain amino acid transport system permease protein